MVIIVYFLLSLLVVKGIAEFLEKFSDDSSSTNPDDEGYGSLDKHDLGPDGEKLGSPYGP